jgi:hypothetical protein
MLPSQIVTAGAHVSYQLTCNSACSPRGRSTGHHGVDMAITNEKVERTSHNQTGAKHKRTELMREWDPLGAGMRACGAAIGRLWHRSMPSLRPQPIVLCCIAAIDVAPLSLVLVCFPAPVSSCLWRGRPDSWKRFARLTPRRLVVDFRSDIGWVVSYWDVLYVAYEGVVRDQARARVTGAPSALSVCEVEAPWPAPSFRLLDEVTAISNS